MNIIYFAHINSNLIESIDMWLNYLSYIILKNSDILLNLLIYIILLVLILYVYNNYYRIKFYILSYAFSYLYEDLQELIFKKDRSFNAIENICNKKYSNGDIYKTLEYDHIVVLELEHNSKNNETSINFIKELSI